MDETVIDRDLPDTPEGQAQRWTAEFQVARKELERWHTRGEKIIQRYLDDRKSQTDTLSEDTRLNLFTANTQTMESLLFGRTPQVGVARRFADSADDEARVAAEMLERLLNTDIERDSDTQQEAFKHALGDRLRVGLGNVRLRYNCQWATQPETPAILHPQTGEELAPAVPEMETKVPGSENVDVDYVYWKDQLWSPCRTFADLRWWAFKAEMTKEQLEERFGEEVADQLPMNTKKHNDGDDSTKVKEYLQRCDVWEIWSKEKSCVYWFVEGFAKVLDEKDDPLGLDSFWPFPRPMFANLTTSKLLPTPDFVLAQDLYDEIDVVSTRITILERAVRVVGAYDKNCEGIKRMISETSSAGNEMIPVDGWELFAEKGGIKGRVDWMPLEAIVNALSSLREYRSELLTLLYQVTGMSDIMRGQATQAATATEQAIKARFASVRVQTLQDEFARFCSDVQRLKAEIIAKHFDPETIIERSNVQRTPDAQLAPQAVQLIKSSLYNYRVSVDPDSVSLQDFSQLKAERMEWLQTLSGFFQMSMPVVQTMGATTIPFLLQIAQWTLAGLKGSNEIEGVFDQAIASIKQQQAMAAQNPPPPPPPDPKVQAAQIKGQAEQFKAKADVASTAMDFQVAKQKHAMEMEKMHADHALGMQKTEAQIRQQALETLNQTITNQDKE